jgi:hypothetical protein
MSYIDTLRALYRGHTARIMRLANDVKYLRAFLIVSISNIGAAWTNFLSQTTSQEEKARRVQERERGQTARSPEIDDEPCDSVPPEPAERADDADGISQHS